MRKKTPKEKRISFVDTFENKDVSTLFDPKADIYPILKVTRFKLHIPVEYIQNYERKTVYIKVDKPLSLKEGYVVLSGKCNFWLVEEKLKGNWFSLRSMEKMIVAKGIIGSIKIISRSLNSNQNKYSI